MLTSALHHLPTPTHTDALAARLAPALLAGDVVLLEGPVGAGKTHFARAVIRALCGPAQDVPSPTFTLVQTYTPPQSAEIWHADLYRLGDASELEELGLLDAFDTAICLVEWPERLGPCRPARHITVQLTPDPIAVEARSARLRVSGSGWSHLPFAEAAP